MQKAFQLMTSRNPLLRSASRLLHSILRDSARAIDARKLEHESIPERLLGNLPEEDVYLVVAYLTAGADKLVHDRPKPIRLGCRLRNCLLPDAG